MQKIRAFLKDNFNEFWLIFAAVTVSIILIPIGVLYNLFKSIRLLFSVRFFYGLRLFLIYWVKILYQLFVVSKYLLYHLSIALDMTWNVTANDLLEDLITKDEDTVFGYGDVTVSAAVGRQHAIKSITPLGMKFSLFLNKVFNERHHSLTAWYKIHLDERFYSELNFSQRLDSISALPKNWDGFGSDAPSIPVIDNARDAIDVFYLLINVSYYLRVRDIIPTSSNTILFNFTKLSDNPTNKIITIEVGEPYLHIRAFNNTEMMTNKQFDTTSEIDTIANSLNNVFAWFVS